MKRFWALFALFIFCIGLIPTTAQVSDTFPIEKEAILSALYEADIATLREAIDLRLISCEELTAYYLARISTYGKLRICFISMCDEALAVARQRDQALADGTAKGMLFGIPVVIKDNMNLIGYHTTNGYAKSDDQIATSNARVVEYLLSEGAVIIAKANMSAGAGSSKRSWSYAVGETKNAYSKYISAAGSSGGSAVATSLNFTAASLGTDTNSSLRLPAAYAGCVSLRGTHGLISRSGIKPLDTTRDIAGAITRTVYDQAIMLDVLTAGEHNYTNNLNSNALEGLRIGVFKELCYPLEGHQKRQYPENFDAEVSSAFANALEELRLCGAELVEVSMPEVFTLSDASLNAWSDSSKLALYNAFIAMLEEYQVSAVVYPTYLSTPLRSGTDQNGKYWDVEDQMFITNCAVLSPSASLPEINVPIGLHSLGCGIGLAIAAAKNQEQLLLDIAYTYTSRYDHRIVPETVPDAYADANIGTLKQIIEAYKVYLNPPETEPSVPETTMPETTVPETTVPEATVPEATVPETTVPQISDPVPSVPPTFIPEPPVPVTSAPIISAPATSVLATPSPATSSVAPTSAPSTPSAEPPVLVWLLPSVAAVVVTLTTVCISLRNHLRQRKK